MFGRVKNVMQFVAPRHTIEQETYVFPKTGDEVKAFPWKCMDGCKKKKKNNKKQQCAKDKKEAHPWHVMERGGIHTALRNKVLKSKPKKKKL